LIEVHRAGNTTQAQAFDTLALAYTQIEGDSASSNVLDEDYAVLVTNERLGDRFGWVGTKEYDSDLDGAPVFATMGYPASSLFPVFQVEQWLDEDAWDYGSGRAMTTSADLLSGQSGSPMFATWSDGVFATAVMSSDDPPENENWCAGGADIVRLVNFARSEHP
jgi:V8-like Glu-specific endopeptidase